MKTLGRFCIQSSKSIILYKQITMKDSLINNIMEFLKTNPYWIPHIAKFEANINYLKLIDKETDERGYTEIFWIPVLMVDKLFNGIRICMNDWKCFIIE